MLVTFKSRAAADVVMMEANAKQVLDLFSKDVKRGVFTSSELPKAIEILERMIDGNKHHAASDAVLRDVIAHNGPQGDDHTHDHVDSVGFASRAYPLLEMMRATYSAGNDMLWGV